MYAIRTPQTLDQQWHAGAGAGPAGASLIWRARWVLLALAAAGLLGLGYAREARGSAGARAGAAAATVTVAPGDTLWAIATRRYPHADVREKVFEIEQLNGLASPTIEAGQRLKVPAS